MSHDNGFVPDEIMYEILTRLRPKSLCRFRRVSKHWLSLIDSPYFITVYYSHSPSWTILDSLIRVVESPKDLGLSLAQLPSVSSFFLSSHLVNTDQSYEDNHPVLISGSCGLILFTIPSEYDFLEGRDPLFVCSPFTHQWLELPTPPNVFQNRSSIVLATKGSGSVPGLGGFVVDFVVTELKEKVEDSPATLLTFSSETGKWEEKTAENAMLDMDLFTPSGVIELDGHLFWFDKLGRGLMVWDDPFSHEQVIQCRFLPLPEVCAKPEDTPWDEDDRCFGIGKGCVQYLERVNCRDFRFWRLSSYYDGGEWVLLHAFSMDSWIDSSYLASELLTYLTPVVGFFHPFEADVVFFMLERFIFSANLMQKKILSSGDFSILSDHVLPFALPIMPTLLPPLLPPILLGSKEVERGDMYTNEGNFNQAIDSYTRSIHHSPTAVAFAKRASAFLAIDEFLTAENDCTNALELDDQNTTAYFGRALARARLGKLREAIKDAEICFRMNPSFPRIRLMITHIKFKIFWQL